MFQHRIFLFRSPAGLLLSPSICLPLSFPPSHSFPNGDWQDHLIWGWDSLTASVVAKGDSMKNKSPEPVERTYPSL